MAKKNEELKETKKEKFENNLVKVKMLNTLCAETIYNADCIYEFPKDRADALIEFGFAEKV